MEIVLIAAIAKNGVIGKGQSLPWHYPEDLKFFRETTLGKAIIMGRKTFESINRPLPKRYNIVLTNDPHYPVPEGVGLAQTSEAALALAEAYTPDEPCFVIGGAAVYQVFLPLASGMILTRLLKSFEGDVFFPDMDWSQWHLVKEKTYSEFVIQFWERKSKVFD